MLVPHLGHNCDSLEEKLAGELAERQRTYLPFPVSIVIV